MSAGGFSRTGRLAGLALMGVLAAGIALPAWAGTPAVNTDPIVTASINPSAEAPAMLPQGSGTFRRALDLVASGNYTDAYQLAASLPDDLERRTAQWAAIYYGNGSIDYATVARFAADAPDFASDALYRTRLEQSLVSSNPSPQTVLQYFGAAAPQTAKGQILLAAAYEATGAHDKAVKLARSMWANDTLDADTEKLALQQVGKLLTRDDHWSRTVNLLMTDQTTAAARMLPRLSGAQKSLAVAGIAVIDDASNAGTLLGKVDPSLKKSAVFYFMAAQHARLSNDFARALADLNAARGPLPAPAQWWYERRTLIRQLLLAGNAKSAFAAAASYTSGPEGRLVEARFHAGWIALAFLNDAKAAKPQFEKMIALSTLPDTVTQGNYWLGRTLLALGDIAGSKAAFEKAARYGTSYYGLLSRDALGLKGVTLRPMPAAAGSAAAFDAYDVVRGVKLLVANGHGDLAAPLLKNFAQALKDGGQLVLAARLAQTIDAHYLAIEIADLAEQRGAPLDLFSYPMDALPPTMKLADIDRAAVYAIARQESKFRIDAVSRSGARGLMQLMPGTAKEMAAKMGLAYSPARLVSDGQYNALIGSTYLAGQLKTFDGSLALAAAGYNAGAGNAAKWVTAFGDPRASNVDPVVWVELIPFEETRRYVEHVLANYVIYRARLGAEPISMSQALRRIPS